MDFEKNIQLILVNDGSPDNSEKICLKYKSQYPDNIIYIKKENGGVSSARNEGMKYITGKYVNFFDGDDVWEKNAFQIAYDFFEKNYDLVDVIAARISFFDAQEGYKHALDYKFKKTDIVNISAQYSFVQLSSATTFIKSEILKNRQFDTRLKFSEDTLFMTPIILQKWHMV